MILNNLRKEIEIEIQDGVAELADTNQLARDLDLIPEELNEAIHLLRQLKREQAKTNGIKKQRKLLIALSRYA